MVNFILRLVVAKKGIRLTNSISPLMFMFLLAWIISRGAVIYSVAPRSVLVHMVLPFSAAMVVPYIFLRSGGVFLSHWAVSDYIVID